MDEKRNDDEKASRPRGRPPGRKGFAHKQDLPGTLPRMSLNGNGFLEASSDQQEEAPGSRDFSPSFPVSGPGSFATLLGYVIKNDRSEVLRIAREIGVSDNTVYRWLNGTAEPRHSHLMRLLEVLPRSNSFLSQAGVQQTYAGRATSNQPGRWDVQKEIYRRVMELAATTVDDASRRWHVIETIFEYALLHLDPDRQGLALTYARLMPPRADGTIHSLYEAEMRGQAPWPFAQDFKAYLGSTTLAGAAAMLQRAKVWSVRDEARTPVGLDENERSSCAAPVMRGGRLAGVLIISSAQEDFVRNPSIPRAVGDYAHLLAAGLMDSDFYAISLIRLVPMPELDWQRAKIAQSYLNRVVEYARKECLSFAEAEQKVLQDLEEEFERHACQPPDVLARQEMSVESTRE
jgi:transcriptional regulator with XRE-family HTH domain